MSESAVSPKWDDAERAWLKAAYKRAGHTQGTCAAYLEKEYGVADASQVNVCRWISGITQRPRSVEEVLAYCERFAPDARPPQTKPDTKVPPEKVSPDEHPHIDPASAFAQELASQLRALRAQLKRERARSSRLSQSLEDMNSELTRALVRIGQLDRTARSYSGLVIWVELIRTLERSPTARSRAQQHPCQRDSSEIGELIVRPRH